jgi:hypothetical protein
MVPMIPVRVVKSLKENYYLTHHLVAIHHASQSPKAKY